MHGERGGAVKYPLHSRRLSVTFVDPGRLYGSELSRKMAAAS